MVMAKNLVVVLTSLLVCLALLEAATRIWLQALAPESTQARYRLYTDLKPQDLIWSSHHYLNYYPTPNYRNGPRYHNSLGYRGPEISETKPAGGYRIVALGGSTTYTEAVKDNKKTFTSQLERILRQQYGRANIEVINAGAGGYNSWESLINLQFRVLDLDPDLIIVYHGTNDVHARLVAPDAYRGDNSGARKQWAAPTIPYLVRHSYIARLMSDRLDYYRRPGLGAFVTAKTNLADFSGEEARSVEHLAVLTRNPPKFFERNLTNMIAVARAHGIDVILATWAHSPHMNDYAATDHYRRGFKENNQIVREVAGRENVNLFDFASVMPVDGQYWSDGRHVNEGGALLKAKLFADYIHNRVLAGDPGGQ